LLHKPSFSKVLTTFLVSSAQGFFSRQNPDTTEKTFYRMKFNGIYIIYSNLNSFDNFYEFMSSFDKPSGGILSSNAGGHRDSLPTEKKKTEH
jgi:hypothetical protein